jgi:peptidylprolyl isomerase
LRSPLSSSARWLAALAVAAPAAFLAGCAGPVPQPGVPVPVINGPFGKNPAVTIPDASPPHQLIVKTLLPGSGPVVRRDDYVVFNVEGEVWAGSRQVVDSFTEHAPQGLPLANAMPAWRELAGQRVGSRVLMVVPPADGFGRAGEPAALVTGTDTLVFVFDVLATMAPGAAAARPASYGGGPAMPDVRWGSRGPVIAVPRGSSPPRTLVRRVLVRGSGPPVLAGDTVTVQDTGVVWKSGKVFDSTWQRGFPESFVLGAGQVIPGWEDGIGGVRVGSRLLLVVPPALGYGRAGDTPYVSGTDTVVFVVDVVSALPPSAA